MGRRRQIQRGLARIGSAVTPGAKRHKSGSTSVIRDKKTGRVRSPKESTLAARGAGTVAAGGAGAAGAVSLFKDDEKSKPRSQASRRKSRTGNTTVRPANQATKAKAKKDTERFEKDTRDLGAANIRLNKEQADKKKTWKDVKSVAAAKKAGLKHYTGSDGKKKLAITKEELGRKKGETLTQAYNRVEGKTPRKPAGSAKKPAAKKKVGGIRKFLLGDDGKFGGARGAIDFLPGKSRPKKPVKKMGGGMMKSKMASKGGARGGKKMMMPGGMKAGGSASKFPDLTGDGQVTQADILKGRGVIKKRRGGMAEPLPPAPRRGRRGKTPTATPTLDAATRRRAKTPTATPTLDAATRRRGKTPNTPPMPKLPGGMKNGGMAKKGYAKGGMAKKGYSKGGAVSRKPRGVGAALRGYGKALK